MYARKDDRGPEHTVSSFSISPSLSSHHSIRIVARCGELFETSEIHHKRIYRSGSVLENPQLVCQECARKEGLW